MSWRHEFFPEMKDKTCYMVGALFACFFDVVFQILQCAGIAIFFALLTVFSGFMVLQPFQVSQEL